VKDGAPYGIKPAIPCSLFPRGEHPDRAEGDADVHLNVKSAFRPSENERRKRRDKKIIVVGAGPAGMMAAIRASQLGRDVTLLEKKPSPGNKLLLSGKGRCNLTNACPLDFFLERFSKNGAFLRDAFKIFFNQELIDFFESRGLRLKTERQLRVFPVTNRSSSILEVLQKELSKLNVEILLNTQVTGILLENKIIKGVKLKDGQTFFCEKLILATGGASYSATGSDGQGLKLTAKAGHTIIPLRPGLVPLEVSGESPKKLEGLTLKNIRLKFSDGKGEIVSEVGELLFTSSGISGPLVITLSSRVIDWLEDKKKVLAQIDLKPGLSIEQLDNRLLRDLKINSRKNIRNALKELLPLRLIDIFIEESKVNPLKKCSQITQKERQRITALLKNWRLDISGSLPLEEAMVTRGGVSLKEINPRTLESKLFKGLYFCGEMIDVDADTGGFNLQAAFSTGFLAGESAAAAI